LDEFTCPAALLPGQVCACPAKKKTVYMFLIRFIGELICMDSQCLGVAVSLHVDSFALVLEICVRGQQQLLDAGLGFQSI
jgi:hypothetical protein